MKHDVKLVNMLPHMHLRGKSMEFRATYPSGETEVLLRVPATISTGSSPTTSRRRSCCPRARSGSCRPFRQLGG